MSVYPNPIKDNTNIIFEANKKGNITVKIFNILGSEILTVFNQEVESGFYSFDVNLSNIDEGIYFLSILSEWKVIETTKMIIQ